MAVKKTDQLLDFKSILGQKEEVSLLIHNFPDPDAISSAMAISQYLKNKGYKIPGIYYTGEISHPQNRSMITLLNIDLIDYEESPFDKSTSVILVDTNSVGENSNQPCLTVSDANIVAVVDHHKGKHPKTAKVDCRYVGATASIVWDYLSKGNFDFESEEGQSLATALVVGITTDTDSLMSDNTQSLDFEAYQDLLKKVDRQKLNSIMKYPLPPYLFDLRQRAFLEENKHIEDATLVSGIGIISPSKRDALPIIADEFLRMSGITTSVAFAIIDDYIDISVRSKDITVDVGAFLNKVFATGGGKQGAGRAKIPLGFFSMNGNTDLNNDIWEVVKKLVFTKIFSNVKGD